MDLMDEGVNARDPPDHFPDEMPSLEEAGDIGYTFDDFAASFNFDDDQGKFKQLVGHTLNFVLDFQRLCDLFASKFRLSFFCSESKQYVIFLRFEVLAFLLDLSSCSVPPD